MTPEETLAAIAAAEASWQPGADGECFAAACDAEALAWEKLDVGSVDDPAVQTLLIKAAFWAGLAAREMARRERAAPTASSAPRKPSA